VFIQMSSCNSQDSIEYVKGNLNANSSHFTLHFDSDIKALCQAKECSNTKSACKNGFLMNVPKSDIYKEILNHCIKSKSNSGRHMALNEYVNNFKGNFKPSLLGKIQNFSTKSSSLHVNKLVSKSKNAVLPQKTNFYNRQSGIKYSSNFKLEPNFSSPSSYHFPTSKVKHYSNEHDKVTRIIPEYDAKFLNPNDKRNYLQPKIVRKHNLIGVEVVDPSTYMRQHESVLMNSSQLPNLDITKWFDSRKIIYFLLKRDWHRKIVKHLALV
jgi:hypothetical protein